LIDGVTMCAAAHAQKIAPARTTRSGTGSAGSIITIQKRRNGAGETVLNF